MSIASFPGSIALAAVMFVAPVANAVAADAPADTACPKEDAPPVRAARAALEQKPEALEPRLELAAALRDQGCYAASVHVLEEGEALHGRNAEFQARLRTPCSNVSEQHYIEWIGPAEEAAKAQRYLLRCSQLADLAACDEALKGRPNDPQLLSARGDALMKATRPTEAAAAYRRAAEIDPANSTLAPRIAAAEEQRKKFAAECSSGSGATAVKACDAALVRGAADEFAIQRRKGLLLQGMGESSRALDAYIAADAAKSGDRPVALAIVSLTKDGKRRDAIALAARGSALLTLRRGRDAAVALRQARALSPGLPDLARKLAAAEKLARAQPKRAAAPAAGAAGPEEPARRYSNDAPTTQSH